MCACALGTSCVPTCVDKKFVGDSGMCAGESTGAQLMPFGRHVTVAKVLDQASSFAGQGMLDCKACIATVRLGGKAVGGGGDHSEAGGYVEISQRTELCR